MSLILSGTDGLSDVDGTVGTPAIRGTDANTGIFFPAADTIAFSEGGVEAMRIDSSGQVGIGTTSPSSTFHVSASAASARIASTGANGSYLRFYSNNQTTAPFEIGQGLNTGTDNVGYVWNLASAAMSFGTSSAERMRIDSSGNLLVGITSARANAGDVQVSKGISFPATQSAQSDANTLDDYEEGTWTPVITVGGGSITYTASGHYTKVGRMVTVTGTFLTSAASSPSGVPYITGLPFTIGYASAGSYSITNAFSASLGSQSIMLNMEASETRIRIAMQTSGDWGTFGSYFDASCGFNFSATYFV